MGSNDIHKLAVLAEYKGNIHQVALTRGQELRVNDFLTRMFWSNGGTYKLIENPVLEGYSFLEEEDTNEDEA